MEPSSSDQRFLLPALAISRLLPFSYITAHMHIYNMLAPILALCNAQTEYNYYNPSGIKKNLSSKRRADWPITVKEMRQ